MNFNQNLIYITFLFLASNITSQSLCDDKCFVKTAFKTTSETFEIEKKWESEEKVPVKSSSLIYDIDMDNIPEIISLNINTYNVQYSNEIIVFHSLTGKVKRKIKIPYIHNNISSTLLLADVDNDCKTDIIISCSGDTINPIAFRKRLICLDIEGTVKWISNDTIKSNLILNDKNYGTISIADFNHDGIPEVYIFNEIFNAQTGVKLIDGGDFGKGIGHSFNSATNSVVVAANLDDDPELELAAGYTVYKVNISNVTGLTGNTMNPINFNFNGHLIDGFTAVADINMDGKLDIIVASLGKYIPSQNIDVSIYCYTINFGNAELVGKIGYYFPNKSFVDLGVPLILYNNQFNRNDIIVTVHGSGFNEVGSFRYDSNQTLRQNWGYPINDVLTYSGLTAFDFNNDGNLELLFRDQNSFKILNFKDDIPTLKFSFGCFSDTGSEYPIIADIDNSGQAKICVTCAESVTDFHGKLNVFGAPEGQRWAPARKIWHQYAYNPLFINDDGTIPQFQNNHATYQNGKYNNFLVQESLIDEDGNYPAPATSLTVTADCVGFDTLSNKFLITFSVHNHSKASLTAPINLPLSFYEGNPETDGVLLGTYLTMAEIASDSSLNGLTFSLDAQNSDKLFIVVNTDMVAPLTSTETSFLVDECDYTDNIYQILLPKTIQETKTICQSETIEFFGSVLNTSGLYFYKFEGQNGCDSIIHSLDLAVVDTVNTFINESACNSYLWNNQTYTQSGLYTYQTINANGCDSIATLDLTIFPSSDENTSYTACDSYFWNNQTYTQSGLYTFQTTNQYGCDSIISLDLTVNSSHQQTITHTTCDDYTWNGQTYNQSGVYTYATTNQFGCDSILTLDLTINNTILTYETQTACDAYFWNNQTYTQSGSYTYQTFNANGCDSITTLDLTIFPSSDENISATACDSYFWNNQTYTQSGLYNFQTTNQYGCDSVISLDLTVNPSYQVTITHTTCDDYTWNGQTYNQSGVYTYATVTQFGCDSILTLDLTINNTILTNEAQTACDAYFWNNQTYTQSGSYTYQTINANGCDSITTLDLTIFPSSDENISATACDSYFWNNQTYTQSGLYNFQTTNQYGCDSVISLDLTVNPSYQVTITHTTCDDYTWNGQTYNQSGVYTYATITQFGCDSILTLDLTINNTILTNETQTACDVYFWNNQTYTQSGSYTYQTINGDGCDSIAMLELTIFESNSNNISQSACQSFEYENQVLTESGIYTFNLQNSFGCDSIVTLELEILDQFTSQSVSSCDQYIWPANGQTYVQSGIYTDTLQNIFGCDSVLQLVLNISPSFNIPDQKEVCDHYLWTPNNTTYTQSGFYQLDLKTAQGCDSILTLDLTVQPSFMQIDTVISNTEYTWQINNTTYATSGIYTEKWLTPSDCDSIHQLLLTIKSDSDIYFPNIILPNSQNSNFAIFGSNSIELIQSLSIYDRWSNLVFHQENFQPNQASLGWNGKFRGQPVIPGVYVWTAQIRLSDGTTLMKSGDVTVVE